ncbi:RxLR effector protein [Phytophthora megakarya]|uniref:RxLR effector protein n=1 Tax=Phytophthora megakarya TaxID=4795 RepID=A0A225VSB3_9STRA|nr:RxLR effector protein [Phytophthora megakarya]
MYLRNVSGILIIILLTLVSVALALSDPDPDYKSTVNVAREKGDGLKRRLRSDDGLTVDEIDNEDINEDRGGISELPKIGDIMSKILPRLEPTPAVINKLSKVETNPKKAYEMLRLGKDVGKLEDNPTFVPWLQYIKMYRNKRGEYYFSDDSLLTLLKETRPEREVVELLQWMKQVPGMKIHAETMQVYLFDYPISTATRKLMNEAWLKARVRPRNVFTVLNRAGKEKNQGIIQWFRYTEMYRAEVKGDSFSEAQALKFLSDATFKNGAQIGTLLQVVKEVPDLKSVAERMQSLLFRNFIKGYGENPKDMATLFMLPWNSWGSILVMNRGDPIYKAWETYTLQYAASWGGPTLKKQVEQFFAKDNPEAALNAVLTFKASS